MASAEKKDTGMKPVAKLVHWIRHECKTNHPALEENITKMLPKDGAKLEAWLKENCGINHPQLKLAIDNTIKAIG